MVESSSMLSSGLNVSMNRASSFTYNKMWSDSINLDEKGNLQFLIVTENDLKVGSTYQINLILSPNSYFKINDTGSVLTFDGSTLSFSLTNITSQSQISFIFSPSVSKNIFQFQFSSIFIFKDTFTATITLFKQISSTFYQSAQTSTPISL